MKNKKTIFIFLITLSILLSMSFAVFSFVKELNRPKLPVLGHVNEFSLTDSKGEPFLSSSLRGRVWVADFFFTTCSDICPVMSENMAKLHRSFKLAKGIFLVSITVNPEHDTPEVLDQYAKKYDADTQSWQFLTGPRAVIRDVTLNSFKLGSIEEPIFHSPQLALVDRHHIIRGYYDGTKVESVNQLFKDAAMLLKER